MPLKERLTPFRFIAFAALLLVACGGADEAHNTPDTRLISTGISEFCDTTYHFAGLVPDSVHSLAGPFGMSSRATFHFVLAENGNPFPVEQFWIFNLRLGYADTITRRIDRRGLTVSNIGAGSYVVGVEGVLQPVTADIHLERHQHYYYTIGVWLPLEC